MKTDIHVQLFNANQQRLTILQSAKLHMTQLRDYQSFKITSQQKKQKLMQLQKIIKEIKEKLSSVTLKEMPSFRVQNKTITIEKPKAQRTSDKMDEVTSVKDSLWKELEEIDKKLASLGN